MRQYDCLIIGYNDGNFQDYVKILKSMGTHHADYRDLNLNFIEYQGKAYRAADILTHFYYQGKEKNKNGPGKPFHNADVLWMCVTYLGTYLAKRGFTFDYINLFHFEKEKLKEKLETNNYLTVAVTTTIYNFEHPVLEVISFVRRYNDRAKIIVGGPYINKRSEQLEKENLRSFFKYMGADFYVCSREGEQALVSILKALKNRGDFHHIDNIAYKNGNDFVITPASLELNSLEENMIDYTLFPKEDIGHFVNLRVSKGCPYKCSFCGFPLRSSKYKYTGVDHIKRELDAIRSIGTVTHLHFTDDTVNVPKKRFKEIMHMMIKEKYNFKWNCYFRCDHMDEELVGLMKEAGCEGVFLGLESANETVLKNMNKRSGKEDYRKGIPLFKQAGIVTFVSVFIGFPGETVETFRETMDFLRETQPDFYRPQLWYCDPMTPIWQQRERYGLTGNHFAWSHDTMDARTACDLQEEALLTIDTPVWVPDPGFNYITIYLLGQRGMSFEKQKTFLRCFNTVVKEKLLYPHKREISPHLLESLKKSCWFDEADEPDMRPVHLLSAENYIPAETFWVKQFSSPLPRPNPGEETGVSREVSRVRIIEKTIVENLEAAYDADLSHIILAVFSTLLLRLKGVEDTAIVTALDEREPFPLRLYPQWTMSFGEFVQITGEKIREAAANRLYAFYVLTHPLRRVVYDNWSPAFDTAYLVREQNEEKEESDLAERLRFYPDIYRGIDLALEVNKNKHKDTDDVKIQFIYSAARYREETIEKYGNYLLAILQAVADNPDILLKGIILDPAKEKQHLAVAAHAKKAFNF